MSTHPAVAIEYEPEFVCTVQDKSAGLRGYLVVDASIGGHACGGLRMSEEVSIDELRLLARAMTLKYGFSYMAQGGAKAGIGADPDLPLDERQRLLHRFGQLIAPILRQGYYYTGPDMNVTAEDIDHVLKGAGVRVPSPRRGRGKKSGLYTAMAVMVAAEAATSAMQTTLEGKTVAIEGFGSVGSAFAMLMTRKKKAYVVAISTTRGAIYNPKGLDIELLLKLREQHGNSLVNAYEDADRIENEDLLLLDVDILSPCARQFPITGENADRVVASLVCPGANNPVTPAAEEILFRRNIMSIPHFAANCGGVIGNKVETLGVDEEFIESFIRRQNFDRIRSFFLRSSEAGEPMAAIAEREAMKAFVGMQHASRRDSLSSFVQRMGLRAFNAGLVPGFLTRSIAPLYLKRTMRAQGG